MNLFYAPLLTATDKTYVFDKEESHHISKVLRKNLGDSLFLTNGKGGWFTGKIVDNNLKKTIVEIHEYEEKKRRNYQIQIAIAPTKRNDRIEWFLEKATELGIDEITLLLTEHSERKKVNLERYDKIIVSAMKQSLQVYKPVLNPLQVFDTFIQQDFSGYIKTIGYCKAEKMLKNSVLPQKNILLLIGPEGGFSQRELELAFTNGFLPVGLSKNRLRTETAGIVGLTAIHFVNN